MAESQRFGYNEKKVYLCGCLKSLSYSMENFIVSARKYRPATFASVVGQSHITSTLKNAIERGQLAHAYLFCGPRGVGKTTCARIFAKTINCLTPNGSEACGKCESCVGFESGRSMNIHELDAASNNSVDDIRSLIEQVRIIPQVGRYSLFIIDEVHMLSTAAFNAFLKTLEEPPAHAIFILATTERHKILPTILSRCQCYDFNRIRVEDAAEYLRYIANNESITIDDESLNLIAQKADGGMRDALSLFDKAVSFGGSNLDYKIVAQSVGVVDYDTYFRIVDHLLAGNYPSALITFDQVLGMGFGCGSFLTGLARHLRDLLVARDETTAYLMELTTEMMERYKRQGAECSVEFLFGAINLLTTTDGELKRSSNQRLLVELGLMKISTLGKKKNVVETESSETEKYFPKIELPELQSVKLTTKQQSTETTTVQQNIEAKIETTTTIVTTMPQPTVETKEVKPKRATKPLSSIFSLSAALAKSSKKEDETTQNSEKSEVKRYDPEAQKKIESFKPQLINYLNGWRPRFVPLFDIMQVDGHTIKIKSPSEDLRLDILRNETQLLGYIVDGAAIDGVIDFCITVEEVVESKRPVRLEDRITHFTQLSPTLIELTELLDMQVEG